VPNILLTNFYNEKPLQVVKSLLPEGFGLVSLDAPGKEEVIKKAGSADYLLVGGRTKIDSSVLDAAPGLKMIQRSGVGLDSLDLVAIEKRQIPLYVNAGVNARSVAEHTLMLMLGSLRKVNLADKEIRKGHWVKHDLGMSCHDLYGKTVGLIGLGSIGKFVAQMLQPFGVKVIYTKRDRLSSQQEESLNISFCSMSELLRTADIVSLHCPLTDETNQLMDKTAFAQMKRGAFLINTARGGLVDDEALLDALQAGQVAGVGLDTFANEPIPRDHSFLANDDILLTPHMGGITIDCFSSMISSAFANISMFDSGAIASIKGTRVV
jgi:D-3-phosphoglycerate dehydrogenase / 2-oxoglutarate reductase